ncbi:MAG TPA: cytochrome ubiquinol oxidase subunit I [Vicinamibacterales bacterium]|nr:cytochrome ubiquinol oxidase subunit I [Vicinamibacterales bacterium]
MDTLLAARSQMAISLAFHIVFAVIGMAMPVLMVISEALWLRTRDATYLDLTRRWARGTAVFFAVGAVSGTVLSFELGLLWPTFMTYAGPMIGMPFSLEGFAFFLEAIFLGIYLYGWERVPPAVHLFAGVVVAASGALSGLFVVTANAWMNTPAGFRLVDGHAVDIDPIAAMLNPAAGAQVAHMLLAAYAAVGFGVAGIHAWFLRAQPHSRFHRSALVVALAVGSPSALAQPVSGDVVARMVARTQPAKLAAMEGQFRTERGAPLRLGGLPDTASETTPYAIEIPGGLSWLAFHNAAAIVPGLDAIPRRDWPPVPLVHLAFQIMVAAGTLMAGCALWTIILALRRADITRAPVFLSAIAIAAPLGFVALEAGWMVTELGRQPWIITHVMRTADAVTPVPRLELSLALFTTLYLFLAAIVIVVNKRQVLASPRERGTLDA